MKISEFGHRNHARLGRHSGLQDMAKLLKSKGVIRLNGELAAELLTTELPRFVAICPAKILEIFSRARRRKVRARYSQQILSRRQKPSKFCPENRVHFQC